MTHYTLCGVSFHAEIPGPPRRRHYPTPVVEVSAGSKALATRPFTRSASAHKNTKSFIVLIRSSTVFRALSVKRRRAVVPVLDVLVNLEAVYLRKNQ